MTNEMCLGLLTGDGIYTVRRVVFPAHSDIAFRAVLGFHQRCPHESVDGWHRMLLLTRACRPLIRQLKCTKGDGVAQLVEHRLDIQRSEVRTPSGTQYKKNCESFSESNFCADSLSSVCPTPVCIRTHNNGHVRTLKIL